MRPAPRWDVALLPLNLDEYYSNNVEMFEKVLSTLEMAIVAKGQN